MILEIHMLDNVSETSLVQMIQSFCGLQAVVSDFDNKPKLVIIHQQSEILTESFVHFLDNNGCLPVCRLSLRCLHVLATINNTIARMMRI